MAPKQGWESKREVSNLRDAKSTIGPRVQPRQLAPVKSGEALMRLPESRTETDHLGQESCG